MPYAEFKELLELNDIDENTTLPHEVVKRNIIDGKSILYAWREHLNITQEDVLMCLKQR